MLQINDIVHLNSGSPDLEVTEVIGDLIKVQWLDGAGNLQETNFPRVCVHKERGT